MPGIPLAAKFPVQYPDDPVDEAVVSAPVPIEPAVVPPGDKRVKRLGRYK